MINWENGLHICEECHGEFASDELEPVIGGVETDYCEIEPGQYAEWTTGRHVEMTTEQYEQSKRLISILLCSRCRKKRDNETAARLLSESST